MTHSRRRAVLLIEMITVLICIAVGGTLMTVSLASILRSHGRVAEFGNRYAVLHDFLHHIRRDVRASAAEPALQDGDGAFLRQTLTLGNGPRGVSYRIFDDRVERLGSEGDPVADKNWDTKHSDVKLRIERAAVDDILVHVSVVWNRASKDDPAPTRRFDLALRPAKEIRYDREGR